MTSTTDGTSRSFQASVQLLLNNLINRKQKYCVMSRASRALQANHFTLNGIIMEINQREMYFLGWFLRSGLRCTAQREKDRESTKQVHTFLCPVFEVVCQSLCLLFECSCVYVCLCICVLQSERCKPNKENESNHERKKDRERKREREKLGQRSKYQVRCQRQIIHSTEVSRSLCPFAFTVSLHLHLFQCLFQFLSEYNTFPNLIFHHLFLFEASSI